MAAPTAPPAPGQPGGAQMIAQPGFMMPNAPGGQPTQMFQPMYPALAGAPMQRTPAGNMPPQGQQPMVFNQQGMVQQQPGPGQQMPMQGQVVQGVPQVQGGVNMGNMQKYMPNMIMMVPAGQAMP